MAFIKIIGTMQGDQKHGKNRPIFWKVAKTVTKLNNAKIQTMFKKAYLDCHFGNTIYYIFIYFFNEPTKVA
jgi:hypothetical protein